jgi:hypothetical protein
MPNRGLIAAALPITAVMSLLTACIGARVENAVSGAHPYLDTKWFQCPVKHQAQVIGESVSCAGEFGYSVPGSVDSRGLSKAYRCPEGFALISASGGTQFKCVDYDEVASQRKDPGCFLLGTMDRARGPEEIGTGHTLKVDERGDRDICRLPPLAFISKLPDFMQPRCRDGERLSVRVGRDHCVVPVFLNRRQIAPTIPLEN